MAARYQFSYPPEMSALNAGDQSPTQSRAATADGPPLPSLWLLYPPCRPMTTQKEYERRKKLLARSLPNAERLPRNEALGGYIFLCNQATLQQKLSLNLFGLPTRYCDSVRAIKPGLPIFLYDYALHQLHGVFKADGFGGTNIDPKAWEDRYSPGQSLLPAQVRVRRDKECAPLQGNAVAPFLHYFCGHHFRLELSVPQAMALLDLFDEDQNPRLSS